MKNEIYVIQFEFCRKLGVIIIDYWIRVCMINIAVGFQIGFLVFVIWYTRTSGYSITFILYFSIILMLVNRVDVDIVQS
ncbi:hypothetical protein ABR780_26350 [Bacillus cereus]|uniref:hypothetical protein n=1 Tax=Bacillus cereus TaxID=1396 RepID=UPI0035582696